MKIVGLQIKSFHNLAELFITFPKVQWIVFRGKSGVGKTSILQAITLALYGSKTEMFETLEYGSPVIVAQYEDNDNLIRSVGIEGKDPYRLETFATKTSSKLLAFSHNRNVRRNVNIGTSYNHKIANLFPKSDSDFMEYKPNYSGLSEELYAILRGKLLAFGIDAMEGQKEPLFRIKKTEKNNFSKIYTPYPYLPNSYKWIIQLVSNIVIHFTPKLGQIEKDKISGIVVIDEFEAGLANEWKYEIVRILTDLFPLVQFIVSTNSAIITRCVANINKKGIFNVELDEMGKVTVSPYYFA